MLCDSRIDIHLCILILVEDKLDEMGKPKKINSPDQSQSFTGTFTQEVKEGFSQLREDLKNDSDKKKPK